MPALAKCFFRSALPKSPPRIAKMKIPAITRIMLHIGITAITLSAYSSPKLAAKLAQESSTMKYMGIYVPTIQRLNTAYPIRLFLALL